jgi:hypothetical protein
MKRFVILLGILFCVPAFAVLIQDYDNHYHFLQRTWPQGPGFPPVDNHFYLIEKTAFYIMCTDPAAPNDFHRGDWEAFIENCATKKYNSV